MAKRDDTVWVNNPLISHLTTIYHYMFGESPREISKRLQEQHKFVATPDSIDHFIRRMGAGPYIEDHFAKMGYEEIKQQLDKKLQLPKKFNPKPPKFKVSGDTLVLVISDVHSPFFIENLISYIIVRYKGRVKKLVIAGDFFDMFGASRFVQYTSQYTFQEEFLISMRLLEVLANTFDEIVMTDDNHGTRLYRKLFDKIGKEFLFSPVINFDWNRYAAEKFPNIKVAYNVIGNEGMGKQEAKHFHIEGRDCAIGHFEYSSMGKAVAHGALKMYEYAQSWRMLNKDLAGCKLFLQGHTHRISKAAVDGGAAFIGETGCCCKIQEYMTRPESKGQPGTPGWWELWQDGNGCTDIQRSNFFVWSEV